MNVSYMQQSSLLKTIMAALRSTYGSLDAPDYSGVALRLASSPNASFVAKLETFGAAVTETTDLNYDVSTQLALERDGQHAALEISVVGPFAVLRQANPTGGWTWVTRPEEALEPLALELAEQVQSRDLSFVSRDLALTKVPMRGGDDGEPLTVYGALFNYGGYVP